MNVFYILLIVAHSWGGSYTGRAVTSEQVAPFSTLEACQEAREIVVDPKRLEVHKMPMFYDAVCLPVKNRKQG